MEITREVVLKRAKDIFEIDMSYCSKMFELGLEQLSVNFEMQRNHNEIKHQKVGGIIVEDSRTEVPHRLKCHK